MRIAQVIPYLGRAQGGPVLGLASYCAALAEAGHEVEIFGGARPDDGEPIRFDRRLKVTAFNTERWGLFRRCSALSAALSQANCDLIHSHGLWTDVHRSAAAQARTRRLPHLLTPCGMLMPGALRRRWWKKIPVWLWFQGRALRQAQCLHAKSEKEYEGIRQFGLCNPVAIIPNPIVRPRDYETTGPRDHGTTGLRDYGTISNLEEKAESRKQKAETGYGNADIKAQPCRHTVLFLGRLHPVKGVGRLVEAWMEIQRRNAETLKAEKLKSDLGSLTSDLWSLVIAGPDEAGMRPGLEAALRVAGCGDSVIFTGQLDEAQKWAAYEAADLFVMPSDFENFGNAIVEAMLSGLPVITTTGTPWKALPAQGAGWCVEPNVEAVRDALGAAMAMTDDARREMGRRAAALAAKFSPEQAGADLIRVYSWLLGRGPLPDCVVF